MMSQPSAEVTEKFSRLGWPQPRAMWWRGPPSPGGGDGPGPGTPSPPPAPPSLGPRAPGRRRGRAGGGGGQLRRALRALALAGAVGAATAAWEVQEADLGFGEGLIVGSALEDREVDGFQAKGLLPVGQRCPGEGEAGGPWISLMRFNTTGAAALDVTEGALVLHIRRYEMAQTQVAVYALSHAWSWRITWEEFTKGFQAPVKLGTVDLTDQNRGSWREYRIPLTPQMQRWREDPASNQGIALVGGNDACWSRAYVGSFTNPLKKYRPHLQVKHRLDRKPPTASVTDGPADPTRETRASFRFEGRDEESGVAYYECKLDDGEFKGCSSPWEYHALGDGEHGFRVRAVDRKGNVGPGSKVWKWEVDTQPPAVVARAVPDKVTNTTSAVFRFDVVDAGRGGGATAECKLDDGEFRRCQSPMTFTDLKEGLHRLQVRTADRAGNTDSSYAYEWEVDKPPQCLLRKPKATLISHTFELHVAWSEPMAGFTQDDVEFGGVGASVKAWRKVSEKEFVATLEPWDDGSLTVHVPKESAKDLNGNANPRESNWLVLTADRRKPACKIAGPETIQDGAFDVTFTWDEPVTGFGADGIEVEGASAQVEAQFKPSTVGTRFLARIVPSGIGEVRVQTRPGGARDMAGNPSAPSEALSVLITNGNFHVVHGQQKVSAFSNDLAHVNTFRLQTPPLQIAINREGYIFAADGSGTVHVYGMDGKVANTLAGFTQATGVYVDGNGLLYVTEGQDGTVVALDARFETQGRLEKYGKAFEFQAPVILQSDGLGGLHALEKPLRQIHSFGPDLQWTGTVPVAGLADPTSVFLDAKGDVHIADAGAKSVTVLHRNLTHSHTIPLMHKGEAVAPRHALVDRNGRFSVADATGRLIVFDGGFKNGKEVAGVTGSALIGNYKDSAHPTCEITAPRENQSEAFSIAIDCSEPVVGLTEDDVEITGAGGHLEDFEDSGASGMHYTARLVPASVGIIFFRLPEHSFSDLDFNENLIPSAEVNVTFYGGKCSLQLSCQWQLANYEHELSKQRQLGEIELAAGKEEKLLALRQRAELEQREADMQFEEKKLKMQLEKEEELKKLEKEVVAERAKAEADERIREARATEELRKREQAHKASLLRETVLETTMMVLKNVGDGITGLLDDPQKAQRVISIISAIIFTYFASREGMKALSNIIQKLVGKPYLVRESSKYQWFRSRTHKLEDMFQGMVFEEAIRDRLSIAATSTRNSHKRNGPLRHLLFYGSPGTGKTMAAERLAKFCGLDYAILSGGDVVPLGAEAVTEIHSLFNWAERSPRGVLIFIDEADSFLKRRGAKIAASEQMRSAINALLYRTGTQSTKFMLVLATNRPEDLDSAVLDRLDDAIEFPLPGLKQRENLLYNNFEIHVGKVHTDGKKWTKAKATVQPSFWNSLLRLQVPQVETIQLSGITWQTFAKMAAMSDGMSGREISKLMVAAQAHIYGSEGDALQLSHETLVRILDTKREERDAKNTFIAASPLSPIRTGEKGEENMRSSNGNVSPLRVPKF